jgi:hypothetical protein
MRVLIPKVIISGILLPRRSSFVVVSIYGCRKINIQPCAVFAISRRFDRKENSCENPPEVETKTVSEMRL